MRHRHDHSCLYASSASLYNIEIEKNSKEIKILWIGAPIAAAAAPRRSEKSRCVRESKYKRPRSRWRTKAAHLRVARRRPRRALARALSSPIRRNDERRRYRRDFPFHWFRATCFRAYYFISVWVCCIYTYILLLRTGFYFSPSYT